MTQRIHIPQPCSEDWNQMQQSGNSCRHCSVCATNVYDFRKKPLSEINKIQSESPGEKLCGKYHERHICSDKKLYTFVNRLEEKLVAFRFRRTAIVLVASVLFLSGCIRRHVQGRMKVKFPENKKQQAYQTKY